MATDDSLDDLIANLKSFDQTKQEEVLEWDEANFVPEQHEGIVSEVRGSQTQDNSTEMPTPIFKDQVFYDSKSTESVVTKKRGFFSRLLG